MLGGTTESVTHVYDVRESIDILLINQGLQVDVCNE
jgi:hypothetical protein